MTKPNNEIHEVWNSFERNFSNQRSGLNITQLKDLRDSIFCPGPYYYYVVDFSTRQCSYVHESVSDFFGISPSDFSFERIVNGIHPDDVAFAVECEKMVHEFLYNRIDRRDITSYKINYSIRIKNKDDEYKMISHQALTLSTDEDDKIAHVLNIHTDVSHLFSINNNKISFLGINGRPSFCRIDPFNPEFQDNKSGLSFSDRETEIIRHVADGLTTLEISGHLHISEETVKTHRKNILAKAGCKNMPELIAKCVREAVI